MIRSNASRNNYCCVIYKEKALVTSFKARCSVCLIPESQYLQVKTLLSKFMYVLFDTTLPSELMFL